MHAKFVRIAARAVGVGAVVTLGLAGVQSAALAGPVTVMVPCSTSALAADIATAVNGETLSLPSTCTYTLTAHLPVISVDLAIHGNGSTPQTGATIARSTAGATPAFSLLTVTDGADVLISHVNFTNGDSVGTKCDPPVYDSGSGGAIFSEDGTLTVDGGTFTGNYGYNGGAIFSADGATVDDAVFTGNSADEGGAIANGIIDSSCAVTGGNTRGSAVGKDLASKDLASEDIGYQSSVIGSTFTGNSADDSGGAILVEEPMTVTGDSFTSNIAAYGGGMYVDGGDPTITGSTFTTNTSNVYGGGIYSDDYLTVTGGSFTHNIADDAYGGGIYNAGDLTVNRVAIARNSSYEYGGGIYNEDNLTVSGGSFAGNGSEYGGGIYNDGSATVTGAAFRQNDAYDGGGIYNDNEISVSHSQILENTADDGGGIYNDDADFTLSTSVVKGNHPENCAGDAVAGCIG